MSRNINLKIVLLLLYVLSFESFSKTSESEQSIFLAIESRDFAIATELASQEKEFPLYSKVITLFETENKAVIEELKSLAEQDNRIAAKSLGHFYTQSDSSESIKWYKLAKALGDTDLEFNLLIQKLFHLNDKKSLKELETLALNGNEKAYYHLGIFYSRQVHKSSQANEYFMKAANLGHVKAMFNAAVLMKKAGNNAKYVSWLKKSDSAGYWKASLQVAKELMLGRLWEKDTDQAVKKLKVLADKNYTEALSILGGVYAENAKSVDDYELAQKYLWQAYLAGDDSIKEWLIGYYRAYLEQKDDLEKRKRLSQLVL